MINFFIPETFDLDEHVAQFPPSMIKKFDPAKILYLLNQIIWLPLRNRKYRSQGGYTYLYSEQLRQLIPDYADYINYLIETGVVERNNSYSNFEGAQFTKSYRINYSAYPGYKSIELTEKSKFLNAISKKNTPRERQALQKYQFLFKWLDNGLQIDAPRAFRYLDMITLHELTVPRVVSEDQMLYLAILRKTINDIHRGKITRSFDGSSRRLHTSLTNMKKELRHFLTYKGQELVSLDIKSCQPYLSQLLLRPDFWRPQPQKKRGRPKQIRPAVIPSESPLAFLSSIEISDSDPIDQLHSDLVRWVDVVEYLDIMVADSIDPNEIEEIAEGAGGAGRRRQTQNSFVMSQKKPQDIDSHPFDAYTNIINNGDIYLALLEYVQEHRDTDEKLQKKLSAVEIRFDRESFKKLTMIALYAPVRSREPRTHLAHYLFKKKFPAVHHLFNRIKRANYNALPILLQAIESYIIIDRVCRAINSSNYRIPIYTVHDSIITTRANKDVVKGIMYGEFEKAVGYPPQIKEELLGVDEVEKLPIPVIGDESSLVGALLKDFLPPISDL